MGRKRSPAGVSRYQARLERLRAARLRGNAVPTPRQLEVLRMMVLPLLEKPVPKPPPTYDKLRKALGVSSVHTVFCHMTGLEACGLVEKLGDRDAYWPTAAGKARVQDALTVEARERALVLAASKGKIGGLIP